MFVFVVMRMFVMMHSANHHPEDLGLGKQARSPRNVQTSLARPPQFLRPPLTLAALTRSHRGDQVPLRVG